MLEALRGLGYSTSAALADIVDNSISAEASEVHIEFSWHGSQSRISVFDNGHGMNDAELERAMRLGGKSPLDERTSSDLGRFGMGLKTASFSQCRRLTVASISEIGAPCCLRWDLDAIAARTDDGWIIFEGPAQGSEQFLAPIMGCNSGTLVLWEQLDRIVTDGYTPDNFVDLIDNVERHLAMVFHRMLQGSHPKLRLFINGQKVEPWDPFMTDHQAKPWESPVARKTIGSTKVEVQCHVLPHRDKLAQEEYEKAGGPEGWTAQQGFYVYRNERLLLAGGWLGLGQGRAWNREEAYRLARIRLDIPNSVDAEWKIDIRKSVARPPVTLRPWLTRLAEDTRERARGVFAYRGSPNAARGGSGVEPAWRADHSRSGIRYRIDEKHPAVAAVLEDAGERLPLIKAMLRVVEETVPVQRIWLDTAENKDTPTTGFSGEPPENVVQVLQVFYADMISRRCMSSELAKKTLLGMEPFQNFPELVAGLSTVVE